MEVPPRSATQSCFGRGAERIPPNLPLSQAPLLLFSSPVPQPIGSPEVGAEVELGEAEEASEVPDESNPDIRAPSVFGKFLFLYLQFVLIFEM